MRFKRELSKDQIYTELVVNGVSILLNIVVPLSESKHKYFYSHKIRLLLKFIVSKMVKTLQFIDSTLVSVNFNRKVR
jgi:hypothetical protein